MTYRFALERRDHTDLSSGRVLYSAPGFPAFPVRLASEMFQRALAFRGRAPVSVWDPCCGSGYLLTVLSLVHRVGIDRVIGTDVDPAALDLARRNLALVSQAGLAARSAELERRAELFDKPSYHEASVAAQRLARSLAARGGDLPYSVAAADVFDPDRLRDALDGRRPDIVITDVPYGEQSSWSGAHAGAGLAGMLRALATVLDDDAVIAVAARGRKLVIDGAPRRLASFRVGTRAIALLRPREVEGTS